MFVPGASALILEFGITSSMTGALTVTIYILGFALGPLILASLSEIYSRMIVYHLSNAVYIAFTIYIGCALSTNTTMFLIFRFICGCAASSSMAIGGGSIADLYVQKERGKTMAIFGLGPLLGPVIGGFMTQSLGWRWTFWLILILVSQKPHLSFNLLLTDSLSSRAVSPLSPTC